MTEHYKPIVMVNGLPGNMSSTLVRIILKKPAEFTLVPFTMTGSEVAEHYIRFEDNDEETGQEGYCEIKVLPPRPNKHEIGNLHLIKSYIAVDFSLPDQVVPNAGWYCNNGIPFVMGTTGKASDFEAVKKYVEASGNCAVIAPNMAIPVVVMQAMLEYAATNFPDALNGFELEVIESHQAGKVDTSGTARAMVRYFKMLGIEFAEEQIIKIREPEAQIALGVPPAYLAGHAHHKYSLGSKNDKAFLQFKHNVNGRDVYANGTLRAIDFLDVAVRAGARGKAYSMIDVLMNKF